MTALELRLRVHRYSRSRTCRSYGGPSHRLLREENERFRLIFEELECDGYHSAVLRQNQQTVEMLNSDPVNLAEFINRRRSDPEPGDLMQILTKLRTAFESGQRHLTRPKVFEILKLAVTDHGGARLVTNDTGA